MRLIKYVARAIALTFTLSCGGDSTGPLAPQIKSVSIVNPPASLDLRFSVELIATVIAKDGSTISGIPLHWSSSQPMTLVIASSAGDRAIISAAQIGEGTVYVQAGAVRDSVHISVRPAPVAAIIVAPASVLLGMGRTVQAGVRSFDGHGNTLDDRQATFTSSAPTVVGTSNTGALTALGDGSAVVTVSVESVSTTISVSVIDATSVNIATNIVNPFPNERATDLTATLRGIGDSLVTSPLGTSTSATISGALGLPPIADLVIGSLSSRFTQPAVAHYPSAALPSSVSMVAVPASYDIVAAFTPVCTNSSSADCQSFFPSYFRSGVKAWAAFPIPVMFDRTRTNVAISDADSAALWKTLHDFEAAMGQTLFVPATLTTESIGGFVTGAITVAIDTTIAHLGGETNWYWNSRDEIQSARISFKSKTQLLGGPLPKHEFMHALGLHHTCKWASVMGGYGCLMYDLMPDDVGYAKAAWHVRDAEADLRTTAGDLPVTVLSLSAIAEGEILRKTSSSLAAFSIGLPTDGRPQAPPLSRLSTNALRLPNYAGGDSAR